MQELLAVALGGSIGAVSRYLVTNYIFIRWHCHWPWATFIVNAAGCLAMGFLMVLITEKGLLTPYWRLLLCVGFLGGLTTFSSFSYESLTLLSEGNLAVLSWVLFVLGLVQWQRALYKKQPAFKPAVF